MSLTPTEARDEVLTLINAAWPASTGPLYYWDVSHETPSPEDEPFWGRVTMRHNIGQDDSIGGRLFLNAGTITVQMFSIFGNGLSTSDQTAKVVLDSMRRASTPGGVWFRNVRYSEIGQDGSWFHTQVLADFEYTERA